MGALSELDVFPGQTDRLRDAKAGMGQKLEEEMPLGGNGREQELQIGAGQGLGLLFSWTVLSRSRWDADAADRIQGDHAVLDSRCEEGRESCAQLLDCRRAFPLSTHEIKQFPNVAGFDVGELPVPPAWQGMCLDRPTVLGSGRLRESSAGQTGIALDPTGEVLAEPDFGFWSAVTNACARLPFARLLERLSTPLENWTTSAG
jgi:hypothetical protein